MFPVSMSVLASLVQTWLLLPFLSDVWASVSEPTTSLALQNTAKPGCQQKCGNLTIPYPFGIGKGCSLEKHYNITCHTINKISTPMLAKKVVLDISDTQIKLRNRYVTVSCDSSETDQDVVFDLKGTPYAVSTANKFVVIGCHHIGIIEAETRAGRQVFTCVSVCTKKEDLLDGKCSGVGCCEASVPKGLRSFNLTMGMIYYNTNITSGDCSYSLIVEQSSFKFRAIDLYKDTRYEKKITHLPIVIDWFIKSTSCKDAQKNRTTYVCQRNTKCIDLHQELEVDGYRCKCLQGYEGNPYLSPGCTDINECEELAHNPCSHRCVNTTGSYKCLCPRGYHGDGRIDGSSCTPKSLTLAIPLGLGIGLGFICFILGGYWLLIVVRRRKQISKKSSNFTRNGGLLLLQQEMSSDGLIEKTRIFTADELEKATDSYNEDRVLGEGGHGKVYKGMLSDGSLVAIKKSKIGSETQLNHFVNEVVILSQINHRNVVKLLGCCLETEVPLLVYEFIPNGALSKYIHDSNEDFPITWQMRLQIAIDIAGALTYLHSASSKPVFHRDIKTSNILLDAKYRAKLSDFGTSKSIDIDQTHLTTRVQGTFGYLDPAYFQSNQYTEKSDVYSFGVVLIELLTGKKAIFSTESRNGNSLVLWFISTMETSNLSDNLAARVAVEGKAEAILAVAELARRCVNMDEKQRPTMREVSLELEMISQRHHVTSFVQRSLTEDNVTEINNSLGDMLPDLSTTEEDWSFPLK